LELMWRGRYAKDTFVQPLSSSFNLKATGFHQDRARDKHPGKALRKDRVSFSHSYIIERGARTGELPG
jgi:hypothetical protein